MEITIQRTRHHGNVKKIRIENLSARTRDKICLLSELVSAAGWVITHRDREVVSCVCHQCHYPLVDIEGTTDTEGIYLCDVCSKC